MEEVRTSKQNNYWQRNGRKGKRIRPLRYVVYLISISNAMQFSFIKFNNNNKKKKKKKKKNIYRVSQEEWTKLRESVPYVELY